MNGMNAQLALGSVQFGLAYGVAGRGEAVPPAEVREILATAWRGGIRLIDTAPVYGDIEARLHALSDGLGFDFVSKIPALDMLANAESISSTIQQSVALSRERLGSGLRTLLFHRGDDLLSAEGDVAWRAASDTLAGTGITLGGSFYSPEAAAAARARHGIAVAQLPGNALDQRLHSPAARALAGVEIHLRSVFLQGLLVDGTRRALERVPKAAAGFAAWRQWCDGQGMDLVAAALGVARALPHVRYCLVGVDNAAQLAEILAAWQRSVPLNAPTLACEDEEIIDPRRWTA
jgi:aryl-alcohol dehydrogenase-like predicted oxidoreductase